MTPIVFQASVSGVSFRSLPSYFQILLGHTNDVPAIHNQSFHRSFDLAQERIIELYNQGAPVDYDLLTEYVSLVIINIKNDSRHGRFRYKRVDSTDIDFILKVLRKFLR